MENVVERSKVSKEVVPLRYDATGRHILRDVSSDKPTLDWQSWLKTTFLPTGFPRSVRVEYLEYQFYDSVQALCSYLRGVMCTQALLAGAGVGSATATAFAATIQWVVRDGIGMISSVLFAVHCSTFFGDYVKEWRLFADVINDIGLSLDMISPLVPAYLYLPVLCCSAICKAACGVAAGATKVCITNYFCLSNNVSDVATKENTQETAVTFVGLICGMILSSLFNNNGSLAWISFIFLTLLHVFCNYRAVSCLQLNSINRSRCWFLTKQFLDTRSADSYADMSIGTINAMEGTINSLRVMYNGPQLGIQLHSALQSISSTATITPEMRWNNLRNIFADEMYCILPLRGGCFAVPLRMGATKVWFII